MRNKLTAQYHSSTGEWLIKQTCFFCGAEIHRNDAMTCKSDKCKAKELRLRRARLMPRWDGFLDGELIQITEGMIF